MECPVCKNDIRMVVGETRYNKEENVNYRKYKCLDCGREFFAIDKMVQFDDDFIDTWNHWSRNNTRGRYHGTKRRKKYE